jgi:hypothetical protein
MSTSASRQSRSERNALAEALGLGEAYPLRDLPVRAEPPVAAYGAIARIVIEDSERGVVYRILDQDGEPLPGGAGPEGQGSGADLVIDSPAIKEDIRFTVHAVRPSGREAMLFGSAEVKVGLDDSLPIAVVPQGALPTTIDHGAGIEVEVAGSQEGVTYRLVTRPEGDQAAPDDPDAIDKDVKLSTPLETAGTGGTIRLKSIALADDTLVRVRAVKTFGGNKPTQTMLLKAILPIFVRPDSTLDVSAKPAIVDHGGKAAIRVAKAAPGVSYLLHSKPVADDEFSRAEPPDPASLEIATADGPVHVLIPADPPAWEEPPGFAPLGDPVPGDGSDLLLPVPALTADTMIVVEARKSHGSGADAFSSAERLDEAAAILVRPDPAPPLRLAASVVDGKMIGLSALSGEPGVFYALNSGGGPLGELYLHQLDARDPSLNKGVGAIAVSVDLVVAPGAPLGPNSAAPPPVPTLDIDPVALPSEVKIIARRATTNLTADLGKVEVSALPDAEVQPAAVAAGASAKVLVAKPVKGELYAVAVDGRLVADPVNGVASALSMDTGPISAGARVELWASSAKDKDAIRVERLAQLTVTVA